MELCGQIVKHKVFGRGKIIAFESNYVTVVFDENKAERKFTYPAAFSVFLELENKAFLKQIDEAKNVIAEKEAENKRVNEERIKLAEVVKSKNEVVRRSKGTKSKTSKKNNAVFDKTGHIE